MSLNTDYISREAQYLAKNYLSLPVVLVKGLGAELWDIENKRYIDMMSAYSAVSHGHCHPRLVKTLCDQVQQLSIVSRAFHSDKLAEFLQKACSMTEQERAIPMNTGAEAVETALKAARKWGYVVKGIAQDKAEIIVCEGNFHGRTISVISMSSEEQYKRGFGPLTPGFATIPFGDSEALEAAITENTAAFLVEPIQGEAGLIFPPKGYLKACQKICRERNVLLICDEIQCGLGRSGKFLASQHEGVVPDGLILGKALGGGLLPISLFLSRKDVMDMFEPGDHGSTFGGNQLACAVGIDALDIIVDEQLAEKSQQLGDYFIQKLRSIDSPLVREVRGLGLFIGLEINPELSTARDICLALLERGVLSKDTHSTVVRLAPPLIISKALLDEAFEIIQDVLSA